MQSPLRNKRFLNILMDFTKLSNLSSKNYVKKKFFAWQLFNIKF